MSAPVASFDIFDTLLTRVWAEPHDLFVALGERLRATGLSTLEPLDFAARRRNAETSARQLEPSSEITFAEIYRQLAPALLWSEAQSAQALVAELNLEAASLVAVPGAVQRVHAARQRGARIAFISDTYFPSDALTSWLERTGFFKPGDRLFASGECRAGKWNGSLFRHAARELGADFRTWLHEGDNLRSDVAMPRRLGIAVTHVPAGSLALRERTLRGTADLAPPWHSLLAGAARLARLDYPGDPGDARRVALWETGATIAGPLFFGFVEWCFAEAERRGLTDLFFLARGGQIFHRIAEAILAVRPRTIRCHYLLTSRLAFSGASDLQDPARLRLLANPSLLFHCVQQALANFELPPLDVPEIGGIPRAQWGRNLAPAERAAVADWLLAPERRTLIATALEGRAHRARSYLQASGLATAVRAGLVDTGWMGTIQKNIEFLLGEPGQPRPLTGFYLGLFSTREFACAGEALGYANHFARIPLRRETTHLILLELMARGTPGPLLGFDEESGRSVPRFGPLDPATRAEIDWIQSAILAFAHRMLEAPAHTPAPHEALARFTLGAYQTFFHQPTRPEAEALGRTPHADQMLEQHFTMLCPPLSLGGVLGAMTSRRRRPPGWWHAGQATIGHAPLLRAYLALKSLKWRIASWLGREAH